MLESLNHSPLNVFEVVVIGANDGQMKILTTLALMEQTQTILKDQVGNSAAHNFLLVMQSATFGCTEKFVAN